MADTQPVDGGLIRPDIPRSTGPPACLARPSLLSREDSERPARACDSTISAQTLLLCGLMPARPPRRKEPPPDRPRPRPRIPDPLRRRDEQRKLNPLEDPLAGIKRPLRSLNGPAPGHPILEFEPIDVREIRWQFHASQSHFSRMLGINVDTLRNWEQGRRSPHGPARALLRVAAASPNVVAAVRLRHRRAWWLD